MTLVRWEPARELGTLQREMDRLFGSVFSVPTAATRRRWVPAVDVVETEGEYVVRADLPGLRAEDIKVELNERVLTVSGERSHAEESTGEGYRRIERATGSFSRSLTLPAGVDGGAITARFNDGVLEVHIPRPEQPKPLLVEIETGAAPLATVEATADETVAAA